MVKIVTGKMNSGKSTTIHKMYMENKLGDGFISVKRMYNDQVQGYDMMKLSDKSSDLFVVREEYIDNDVEVACQIGPYMFLKNSLEHIEAEIRQMIANEVSPIYLDEIGQLELYDMCFNNIFKEMVNSIDCIITVREELVDKVIDKYNLIEVEIIHI